MRKLLSLLAIAGIGSSVSTNVVSCSKILKVALDDSPFNEFTLDKDPTKATIKSIWDEVYSQIAGYANGENIKGSDIAADSNISVKIEAPYNLGDTQKDDDKSLAIDGYYLVAMSVKDGDKYFTKADELVKQIKVSGATYEKSKIADDFMGGKLDLSTKGQDGLSLYYEVRQKIASLNIISIFGFNLIGIQDTNLIQVAIKEGDNAIDENDNPITAGTYTATLTFASNNPWVTNTGSLTSTFNVTLK